MTYTLAIDQLATPLYFSLVQAALLGTQLEAKLIQQREELSEFLEVDINVVSRQEQIINSN